VAAFIDDVMIATETEKEHDEIVEEVLRRMEKNDLFVKPEKYVWKVREVGFLGVIIGLDRVRIEKEESSRSSRLASVEECKGYIEVFEVGKLLQMVC